MTDSNLPIQPNLPIQSTTRGNRRSRIMVFDVETTGLITKSKRTDPPPLSPIAQPHILQMSMLIYDTQYWRVVKSIDVHIRIPEDVVIEPFITELTGITREICDNQGISISEAMTEFYEEFMRCDCIVAHNLDFDREMIQIEMTRLGQINGMTEFTVNCPLWNSVFNSDFMAQHEINTFCTMRVGRNICRIERLDKKGKVYFKSPKLSELYEHLFGQGTVPPNLHNSLMDAYVCLRCFVKLRFKFEMRMSMFPAEMFASRSTANVIAV